MSGRRVVIAGATGLVGQFILRRLLADPAVAEVHALTRRHLTGDDSRLAMHLVNFATLPELPPVDEVYLALGTTIRTAGSQARFRAVDFDANLAVARAAVAAGARRAGLVSAMGADARSRIFYNRVKGELEEALTELPFEGLVIARPSLLAGDRAEIGQPKRPLERISVRLTMTFRALIPADYRPISADAVARALVAHVPEARGRVVLTSGEMQPT